MYKKIKQIREELSKTASQPSPTPSSGSMPSEPLAEAIVDATREVLAAIMAPPLLDHLEESGHLALRMAGVQNAARPCMRRP